jgi:hypothetical protein
MKKSIKPWCYALAIILVLILTFLVSVNALGKNYVVGEHPDYAPDMQSDVVEVDGVLYFPDGQPVRNYEQLDVYLNSK